MEQRPNFEGNKGAKTILGNREQNKKKIRFLGNRVTSQSISGDKRTGIPREGLLKVSRVRRIHKRE